MSKIAPENDLPVACSACLQSPAAHTPKIQYVDFNSAYDGPVVKDPMRAESEPGVYIEKVVICETCMREAARLLDLDDVAYLKRHTSALDAHCDQLESEIKEKDRTIVNQGHTIATLIDTPVKRPPGRPQLTGPESHESVIKDMRSEAHKKSVAKNAAKK